MKGRLVLLPTVTSDESEYRDPGEEVSRGHDEDAQRVVHHVQMSAMGDRLEC